MCTFHHVLVLMLEHVKFRKAYAMKVTLLLKFNYMLQKIRAGGNLKINIPRA